MLNYTHTLNTPSVMGPKKKEEASRPDALGICMAQVCFFDCICLGAIHPWIICEKASSMITDVGEEIVVIPRPYRDNVLFNSLPVDIMRVVFNGIIKGVDFCFLSLRRLHLLEVDVIPILIFPRKLKAKIFA